MITIKDNSEIHKKDLTDIPSLVNKITDRTLQYLEKEEEGFFVFPEIIQDTKDLLLDQTIIKSLNGNYRTNNIMGFIGLDDERLIIQSRFSQEKKDYFFLYLLNKVLDIPNIVNLETDFSQEQQILNLLNIVFPYYLRKALRKGIFKTYTTHQYNDSNVKGTIDVIRHINNNIPFTGKIAYNKIERSSDNILMELIRHTIEFIKVKPYGEKLLTQFNYEVRQVITATPTYSSHDRQRMIEANQKNIIHHAFYHEYRSLQRLCLLILKHQKHSIGDGDKKMYGLLFDGAWLWEEYVNSLIKDHFYHPQNKSNKGTQYLFTSKDNPHTEQIYPDFISTISQPRIIADAKYKPVPNIKHQDYLQVLAYMFRFDAKQGYYFYPKTSDDKDETFLLNEGTSYENNVKGRNDIRIIKQGLTIPEASSFDDFVIKIKASEQSFTKRLKEMMQMDFSNTSE